MLMCLSTASIHIANTLIFHEKTKYIELECYQVREQTEVGYIKTFHLINNQ